MENSRFTNAEGGTRLVDEAHKKNILVVEHTKFVATRLLHEQAYKIRGSLMDGNQRSIYVTRSSRVKCVAYDFNILTDLKVLSAVDYADVEDWHEALEVNEVLVCTSEVFQKILKEKILSMKEINVLVLDSCHLISKDAHLKYIMKLYKECEENIRPRILALTYPLFSHNSKNQNDLTIEKSGDQNIDGIIKDLNDLEIVGTKNDKVDNSEDDYKENIESNNINKEFEIYDQNDDDFDMYEKLEWKIDTLEHELSCEADFAEDIDNIKRLSTNNSKPKELIIEYSHVPDVSVLSEEYVLLETLMREAVSDVMEFLNDHRYDPTEIYGEDMYEELKGIPDPTLEPKKLLQQFLYVLQQLGPYGADKAAFTLLSKLEKLKIKVPYERHFLLLCLCTTVFIKIRCAAEGVFEKYDNEWERIKRFCTPKILRFTEILCRFKSSPDGAARDMKEATNNLLGDIDKCNFNALGNKLEDCLNTLKCNLKELPTPEPPRKADKIQESKVAGKRPRTRGRVRPPRSNLAKLLQIQANPDALCGVVFIQQPLMAKVLFFIIVDLSRSHKDLSYICAQYSAGTAVDDVTDTKQFELQRKKQEDVLKKFRMHECNLLLATSALEEGIDLPRCNLVLRWDVPSSYRSYGLCRGRARANRAVNIVMASADKTATQELVANIATYRELDQIICRKCGCGIQNEPPVSEEHHADRFTPIIKPYTPTVNISNTNSKLLNESNTKRKADNSMGSCNKCVGRNVPCKCEVKSEELASVDLGSAISLINRYCAKLPSDTFTRLAPQWWVEEVMLPVKVPKGEMRKAYICTLRLPLNCPIKYNIVGHPMPTQVLARRMVALQACRILHKSGELDNQLMPIGKENFKVMDNTSPSVAENTNEPNGLARPGTTKRRQYYYKRTAWAFTDCQPVIDNEHSEITSHTENKQDPPKAGSEGCKEPGTKHNVLYALVSRLWCSLPERYNTRGRRLHAPQHAKQALGILTARLSSDSFQIPAFPVYTRSGEIRVSVEPVLDADVRLSPRRGRLIRRFMRFIFAEVLRVRRRGMKLQTEGQTHNNYYIVPTIRKTKEDGTSRIDIDWEFLEVIYQHTEERKHSDLEKPVLWHQDEEEEEDIKNVQKNLEDPENSNPNIISKEICNKNKSKHKQMVNPLLKNGEVFVFDPEKYKEAVVTPWYRNQDLPQFFLVAEICTALSPDSPFPSATHTSFRDYYTAKYCVPVTQPSQPLLDVDHTSARLNLLTPRYVNRKGVALPVSSERTRRAKRDRLDQKQILVPELCRVHPFAAPLWFATVALPCVLYRINALLIADEIRRCVAIDVGLGIPKINEETCPGFEWPPLDFGWSLAEVLSMDAEKEKSIKRDSAKETPEPPAVLEAIADNPEAEEPETIAEASQATEKTVNDILQEKEDAENGFEIGTWTNDMASSIPSTTDYDEEYNPMDPLPPNLTFCTSASGGTNWSEMLQNRPTNKYNSGAFSVANSDCSYMSSDFDTDDSDLDSMYSDEDANGFCSSKNTNAAMGIRIEYKTAHEAEAVDLRREKKTNLAPEPDADDDLLDRLGYQEFLVTGEAPHEYKERFKTSVSEHKKEIKKSDFLIQHDVILNSLLPEIRRVKNNSQNLDDKELYYNELFPYESDLNLYKNGEICLENIEINKRKILNSIRNKLNDSEIKRMNCFSMKDVNIDSDNYVNEKLSNIGFDDKAAYEEKANRFKQFVFDKEAYFEGEKAQNKKQDFDFDYQPKLEGHPGPSPSVILQALTMSNANDGINLERLETIGDSFLKFAITAYLYCAHPTVHEGKLSHMRSKQVSNLSLYKLGRNKRLGARMIASKFEPHDNWLPPCHKPPPTLGPKTMSDTQSHQAPSDCLLHGAFRHNADPELDKCTCFSQTGCFIPYNLITQHSIPDKSLADCVEALIGAYLIETGPRGALLFMSWLGIQVLPKHSLQLSDDHPYVRREMSRGVQDPHEDKEKPLPPSPKKYCESSESDDSWSEDEHIGPQQVYEETTEYENWSWSSRLVGSNRPVRDEAGRWSQTVFGELKAPPSPLLRYIEDPEGELHQMLSGYEALERTLQYRFKDRSLLLQALTHASHHQNRLTDCYQRLEFLGDAILDYLITRYLYEDERRHSPGALTDLRSALVNNTIFATLAVRHGFHKYFRHMSPGLNEVLTKYVKIQDENGHSISEEHYLIQEDEMEQAEDVEVPKALGDLFESVAGAIFLDSDMSLGAVWRSYVNLMGAELEAFSACAPKSPVRELLEAEPDTAKFGKPERLADGRRVRVSVEVFGRGTFKGIGRNYRIAKGTAARCALRHLKKVYRS